jgi:hypothetical protein
MLPNQPRDRQDDDRRPRLWVMPSYGHRSTRRSDKGNCLPAPCPNSKKTRNGLAVCNTSPNPYEAPFVKRQVIPERFCYFPPSGPGVSSIRCRVLT